jgi:hypothetical protein
MTLNSMVPRFILGFMKVGDLVHELRYTHRNTFIVIKKLLFYFFLTYEHHTKESRKLDRGWAGPMKPTGRPDEGIL